MADLILRTLDRIALAAVWIGGGALLLAAVMVSTDVLLRKFAGVSMAGADEISGYVFAVATSWAFALVLRQRGNLRVDIVYQVLPKPARLALDLLSFLAIGVVLTVMAMAGGHVAVDSFQQGTISVTPMQTPLAVPQILWIAGFGLALVMWLAILMRVVAALFTGRQSLVFSMIGATSIEDEIDSELGRPHWAHPRDAEQTHASTPGPP